MAEELRKINSRPSGGRAPNENLELADARMREVETECSKDERDIAAIYRTSMAAADFASASGREATQKDLIGDWKLLFASSDEAIETVGTGLQKMPLTRLMDIFVSLSRPSSLETSEILRVLGPFPNVRNTLAGSFSCKGGVINFTYNTMVDGMGNELKGPGGELTREIQGKLGHVNNDLMVIFPENKESDTTDQEQILVFKREPDLQAQFRELRVDI
eukprot:CAMPEP_0185745138 /NCGR_PEP_ID=MMETSP1174-20130828/3412_1 /TAXON_ID=35687 /ORGANISM="Dictyocha speculum, Strain CCMP1381" /LENGTH=217 /DNA_ID=CAMNT_0028418949 /DNA_START=93 /DNA_END=746 /DNA_ORIENTATION=-